MVAILDFQMSISQLFKELQGWNSEFKLITPKYITGTYSDTKLSRFGLASLPMAAILDFKMFISQLFEELQGWNLEFKLITPKSNTGTNFYTKLSRFGLACLPLAAILDFQMSISELFEELQGWNLEFKLIIPKSITGTYFDAMAAILDFVKRPYISCLKSYRAENWNLS